MDTTLITILSLHLAGALISTLLAFFALYVLFTQNLRKNKLTSHSLVGALIYQTITGSALFILQPISLSRFCINMGVYIAIVALLEYGLYMQSKTAKQELPQKYGMLN